MVEALKKLDWYKIGIFALFSVCGLLYSQQNSIIAEQGKAILSKAEIGMVRGIHEEFDQNCLRIERELEDKASEKSTQQIIDIIREEQKAQKIKTEELNKSIQKLNDNILILNEKIK